MSVVVPMVMMRVMNVVVGCRVSGIVGLEVVRFVLMIFVVVVVMSVENKAIL